MLGCHRLTQDGSGATTCGPGSSPSRAATGLAIGSAVPVPGIKTRGRGTAAGGTVVPMLVSWGGRMGGMPRE